MKPTGPTNPITRKVIVQLEKAAKKEKAAIWKDVAERLGKSSRMLAAVNVGALERNCEKGDVVIVPGKVLSEGVLTKQITVGALRFSESGKKKIEAAGGKAISIQEILKIKSDGNIRIMA